MASTYSTSLKLELIGTGEQAGTWGTTTNTNLGTALEQAVVGKADVTVGSTSVTLTLTNSNAAQDARALYLNLTGTPGGAATLEVPAIQKPYLVKNGTTGGFTVTVKVSGQTGVAVPNGKTVWVYNNGTDVVTAIDHIPSLTLGAALPVASGGTGVTTSTGTGNVVLSSDPTMTLTNATGLPLTTGVTGTLGVSNGGTGQTTYTNGQLLIGNTTGNTLTKATLTAGTGISITNGTGSISIAATNNGTVTSVGGTGTVNGISLSGTVTSSGNLTLGGTLSGVSLTTQVTGTLPVANGGTGQTTYTNGQLLIGNTTGNTLTKANLTAGTGISITNGTGSISIAATNNGTVTSVGGTGTVNGISLSGTVTSSGNLTLGGTLSGVSLTTQVTGTLPLANGGTGITAVGTSGNVLTSNGSAWVSQASAGGNYIMRTYTSPATWTKPTGLKAVKVTVVGAGGNGGNVPNTAYILHSRGGAGGGGSIEYITAPSIPGPVTVTVGTAPSKTSSFGAFLSATGGTNGAASTVDNSAPAASAAGGSGSGGDINVPGAATVVGPASSAITARVGEQGALGFSQHSVNLPGPGSNGLAGVGYGGGGMGAIGPGPRTGGAGAAGLVIVEEFY